MKKEERLSHKNNNLAKKKMSRIIKQFHNMAKVCSTKMSKPSTKALKNINWNHCGAAFQSDVLVSHNDVHLMKFIFIPNVSAYFETYLPHKMFKSNPSHTSKSCHKYRLSYHLHLSFLFNHLLLK